MTTSAQQLLEVVSFLPEKDRGFAASLSESVTKRGLATEKQQYWLDTLYARASAPAPKPAIQLNNMSGILALFDRATGSKLKHPALTFSVEGSSVRLSMAGETAKFPGSINITSEGSYSERQWFGRIKRDGSFNPSQQAPEGLGALLSRFAADPLGVASEQGKRSGTCCFCNRRLTDKRSTELGYGRVCESRWVGN